MPWVGAGASAAFFPLWEPLLRELWKDQEATRLRAAGVTADSSALDARFKDFFENVVKRDAPLLTDMLGTHRQVPLSRNHKNHEY